MKNIKTPAILLSILLVMAQTECKNKDDEQQKIPIGSKVFITDISQYTFWGERMIITGEGFSSVKNENTVTFTEPMGNPTLNYTTLGGDLKIVSASNTQLEVLIPISKNEFGDYSLDWTNKVEVKVKDRTAVFDKVVKFVGPPKVNGLCKFWSNDSYTLRPGDSVMLDAKVQGAFAEESGYASKLKIAMGGYSLQTNPVTWKTCQGQWVRAPLDLKDKSCESIRAGKIIASIEGTTLRDTAEVNFYNFPKQIISKVDVTTGDSNFKFSKSDGKQLNKGLVVKGENMRVSKIVYKNSTENINAAESCSFCDEYQHSVPVSILPAGSYDVYAVDWCGGENLLRGILVEP